VNEAFGQIEHLEDLVQKPEDLAVAWEILDVINANLFLRFEDAKWGKWTVRKIAGGVLTTSAAPLPIQPYQGRTSSREVKARVLKTRVAIGEGGSETSPLSMAKDRKADSLRKTGRGGACCNLLTIDFTGSSVTEFAA
jgi:hypothetical protein